MRRITILLAVTAKSIFLCGQAAAEKVITLSFTGDCTIGTEELTRHTVDSFDSVAKEKGYSYFFENFRDVFSQDDCTVVNCECVLADSSDGEAEKDFRFRGPEEFVNIFREGSVEAVSLANNHSKDYGGAGLLNTIRVLEEAGIGWARDQDFYIFEKDGIRIAFAGVDHGIMQWSDYLIRDKLLKMQEDGEINAAVLMIHEGKEYSARHLGKQELYSEYFVENAGADLVIIHHPHVLQGIKILNNRCIFYSLGNFVFGGNDDIREEKFLIDKTVTSLYSMVVQVKMTFSNDGTYLGQQATIYPTDTNSAAPKNNFQPYRANAEEAVPIRDAMQIDTKFDLPEITTDENGLSRMELPYLPAFEEAMLPESEEEEQASGPQGVPEAAGAAPTRDTKGN